MQIPLNFQIGAQVPDRVSHEQIPFGGLKDNGRKESVHMLLINSKYDF